MLLKVLNFYLSRFVKKLCLAVKLMIVFSIPVCKKMIIKKFFSWLQWKTIFS